MHPLIFLPYGFTPSIQNNRISFKNKNSPCPGNWAKTFSDACHLPPLSLYLSGYPFGADALPFLLCNSYSTNKRKDGKNPTAQDYCYKVAKITIHHLNGTFHFLIVSVSCFFMIIYDYKGYYGFMSRVPFIFGKSARI